MYCGDMRGGEGLLEFYFIIQIGSTSVLELNACVSYPTDYGDNDFSNDLG